MFTHLIFATLIVSSLPDVKADWQINFQIRIPSIKEMEAYQRRIEQLEREKHEHAERDRREREERDRREREEKELRAKAAYIYKIAFPEESKKLRSNKNSILCHTFGDGMDDFEYNINVVSHDELRKNVIEFMAAHGPEMIKQAVIAGGVTGITTRSLTAAKVAAEVGGLTGVITSLYDSSIKSTIDKINDAVSEMKRDGTIPTESSLNRAIREEVAKIDRENHENRERQKRAEEEQRKVLERMSYESRWDINTQPSSSRTDSPTPTPSPSSNGYQGGWSPTPTPQSNGYYYG